MKFNLDDYDLVEDRIKKFWKDNPNGRIWTEEISVSSDHQSIVIKAMVFADKDDANPIATGIAQDQQGKGANMVAWIENCETSAIGRALANWKYQAKKRPSQEEMKKVSRADQEVKQETKSVDKTGNSNSYTPSPSVQKKIDEEQKKTDDINAQTVEQRVADVMETEVGVTVKPQCMTCGNEVWDNRADKASGKVKDTYPDYKCKTKDCRIWYIDSYANDKKAPEVWYMPQVDVKPRDMNEISDDEAPF